MPDTLSPFAFARGRVRAHRVAGGRWNPATRWAHNDVLYDWATIVSRLMGEGAANYRIAGMYLEYKNVSSPGVTVAAPPFERSGGISYYDGLSASPDVDYLRVPLVAATRDSSDAEKFPGGNRVAYFAQSQGVVGAHGKPFGPANNSKVYGGALVAVPDLADRTRDLVFSRFYFSVGNQQVKLATSQIGLEWNVELQ